jgi:hypothetical protein
MNLSTYTYVSKYARACKPKQNLNADIFVLILERSQQYSLQRAAVNLSSMTLTFNHNASKRFIKLLVGRIQQRNF